MRKFLSADRVTALVCSAAAKARSASPIRLRATEGGLGCWLALEAPPRAGGEGWFELEGIAAEAPPLPPPMGLEGLVEGAPDVPPVVGPRPFVAPFAAALADWTFPNAPVPEAAIAAPAIATVAVPAASPTPTAAKSPPVRTLAPPRMAEANFGDIQHTARNIIAAAARSKPVRAGPAELPIPNATCAHPWESVIPAPTSK